MQEEVWLYPVDKVNNPSPWIAIVTTQLLVLIGLSAMLFRFEAKWYDYVLVLVVVVYEVLVIRALVRRAKTVVSNESGRQSSASSPRT